MNACSLQNVHTRTRTFTALTCSTVVFEVPLGHKRYPFIGTQAKQSSPPRLGWAAFIFNSTSDTILTQHVRFRDGVLLLVE